jgi:hypothetical protein
MMHGKMPNVKIWTLCLSITTFIDPLNGRKLTIITPGESSDGDDWNGAVSLPTGKKRLLFLAGPGGQDTG